MATYKVIQDIEAEDKFVGPLTLRQFIYAAIVAICLYLSFWAITKDTPWALAVLLPPAFVFGILAWPWGRDQPTEVWVLAKLHFFFKPRRRIWDQTGIKELVTITAPKKIEKFLVNDLSQKEVKGRLQALADTIDSRGWAIKNVNVNLYADPLYITGTEDSDRLVAASSLPQQTAAIDIQAADDILDSENNPTAQHLDQLIKASDNAHKQEMLDHMKDVREGKAQPTRTQGPKDLWFMQPEPPKTKPGFATFASQVVAPGADDDQSSPSTNLTDEEQAVLEKIHLDESMPEKKYGHMKVIEPLGEQKAKSKKQKADGQNTSATPIDPDILDLAINNDRNVASLAREANKKHPKEPPQDEVVISLR